MMLSLRAFVAGVATQVKVTWHPGENNISVAKNPMQKDLDKWTPAFAGVTFWKRR